MDVCWWDSKKLSGPKWYNIGINHPSCGNANSEYNARGIFYAATCGREYETISEPPRHPRLCCRRGKKEGDGPLGRCFDAIFEDVRLGLDTWEQAESALQKEALTRAIDKAGLTKSQLQVLFAGDLLNQNIASTFGLREMGIPLIGQFGACSTMGQTLALAALFVDSGSADLCGAVTSSHFCTAERQFRFPLEYGGQRPPSAQWTATASGCAVVGIGGFALFWFVFKKKTFADLLAVFKK